MNRTPPVFKASKALTGFLQHKAAEALSPRTLEIYDDHLKKLADYAGDPMVSKVKTAELRGYLAWLATEYKPKRITGNQELLSPKSVHNVWISLSGFFRWASTEFSFVNPMLGVVAPKFEDVPVEPFKREDIEQLLKAADYMREAKTVQRRSFTMRRATAKRDRAIILFLLDTGLRASELCALKVGDVDLKSGKVSVKHGVGGGAKGRKGELGRLSSGAAAQLAGVPRVVFLSRLTDYGVDTFRLTEDDLSQETPLT